MRLQRETTLNLSQAWKLARENIEQAQKQQKKQYDHKACEIDLRIGDRVMVYMPSEVQGKNWKLARPFHGPYRVLAKTPNNIEVRIVDNPTEDSIFVSLDRVRLCYPEQGNKTWTGPKQKRKRRSVNKHQKDMEATSSRPMTRSKAREQQ